MLYCFVW
ncbi:hypothetical protein LINPERPRIM_LOCUS19092 [Linum perenne]